MELKRVEITGFKSFPEKICVEFDRGITAIVGPNGSGKSNISDAIRWVLGEQSARTLRGSKMEDVIFAGTERRKPVNFAQVTLVLDNSDRKMSIEYDEVAISRRVYRSGESEYTINGGRCRLKDVQELLMDTGIGKDGYSIIGQGQIDQLLSNKPQDRRLIFEEAAGIVKYKSRKETAEKQLADEANNLARIQDILEELTVRIDPLTEQAETAEKYLRLKEELKSYEVTAFLGQYTQYRDQYQKVEEHLDNLLKQIAETRIQQDQIKARADQYKREAGEAREAYKELNDLHHTLEITRQSKEGEKGRIQEQQAAQEREQTKLTGYLEDAKRKLRSQRDTIQREEQRIQEKEKEYTAEEAKRREAEQALAVWKERKQERYQQWMQASEAAEESKRQLSEAQAKNERYTAMLEYDQTQQESIRKQEQELAEQRETLLPQVAEKEAGRKKLEAECKEGDDKLHQLTETIQALRLQIRAKQQEQEQTIAALRETQNRLKWLKDLEKDYEGFSNSVKTVMQMKKQSPDQFRKVYGTVADLITVPSELAVAIEIALGAAIQNVVTEDQDCAKKIIEILRKEQKGRVTFLPMDRVTGRGAIPEKAKVLAMPGVRGFADELVAYDPAYAAIFSRQLGNVVITEDFDSGAAVAKRYGMSLRVVTLQGDIFNIGGSITGGSTMKAGNILSRKGEIDSRTKELSVRQKENERVQAETGKLLAKRQELNQESENLAASLDALREQKQKAQAEEQQARFLLQQLDEQVQKNHDLIASIEQTNREHQESADQYAQEMDRCKEQESQVRKEAEECQKAYDEAAKEESTQQSLEFERRVRCRGIQQEVEYMRRNTEKEEEAAEQLANQADEYLEGIRACESQKEQMKKRVTELEAEQAELDRQIQEKGQETQRMEELQSQKSQLWDQSVQQVEEILQQVTDLEKEQVRLENQKARAQKDLNDLQDRIWQDYELTYNAALALERKDLGTPGAMRRRIGELKEQIKELGPVNVNAITELTALKERCAFLTTQRDDLAKSEANLREIIEQLQRSMEKQFSESFARISSLFEETFRKLFGGGHAVLQLTEGDTALEAGIEIIAQPPGKKLQSMMLLSGGERALTAIALLFAIQQLNPAPFCILDEIEAALDDVNVARYAAYLQELCANTQFIVITHRKGTMEAADTMYGVTMEEKGISKCISVKFEEQE